MIKIIKYKPCSGSANRIKMAEGIPPMKGPKKGITLVIPTITLTNREYGDRKKVDERSETLR